jgi:predicted metal-dependent hydrolase
MSLALQAYTLLFPERVPSHDFSIKYSRKFSDYNANVRFTRERMEFHMSRKWKEVSHEIQIGLLQSLMLKVTREKRASMNIDLYNIFLKKVHMAAPKTLQEPSLLQSFHRVNNRYFDGAIDPPNLVYGTDSTRKLGSYQYGSDTISLSNILRDRAELIDYVMYHELLHKKLKFSVKNGRSRHHTAEFRRQEQQFDNADELERELSRLIRGKKLFRWF